MKRVIIATGIGLCALLSPMGQAFSQTDSPPALIKTEAATKPEATKAVPQLEQISATENAGHKAEGATGPMPQISRELWSGALYTSTYKAGVCIEADGTLRGVLLVRTMSGAVDPYHFHGTFKEGSLRAAHGSGHNFEGSFNSDKEVTGTITLKSGRKVTLTGKRQQNVSLTDTCRPLPE